MLKNISMALAKIFMRLLIFAVGFLIGAVAVCEAFLGLGLSFTNSMQVEDEQHWAEWQGLLSKAVSSGEPDVAAWAIRSYIGVIEKRLDPDGEGLDADDCDTWLSEELVLSYAELASVLQKEGDGEEYPLLVAKALSIAGICDLAGITTEQQLFALMKTRSRR